MNEINVVSYNCRGLVSSLRDVQDLCKKFHIIALQETWLPKQSLSYLSSICTSHHAFGISSVDFESGKPFGGTAILWDKSLPACSWSNLDNSILGLKLKMENISINVINVYLPYCSHANIDKYLAYLSKLNTMCETADHSCLCVLGDFNAGDNNMFGQVLHDFCTEYDFILSDKLLLPNDTFTYVSDSHGSTSWIDHCLSSDAFHQAIRCMSVLHDIITSDHRPLAFTIDCPNLPVFEETGIKLATKVNWKQVTPAQKYSYGMRCKKLLSEIELPTEAIECTNSLCNCDTHLNMIDNFYHNVISAIQIASKKHLCDNTTTTKRRNIPGWNRLVKAAHEEARTLYLNWIRLGKPNTGYCYELMKNKRKIFKSVLRQCRFEQDRHEANALAAALSSDNSGKLFWGKVNKSNKSTISAFVGGAKGSKAITEMWRSHYSTSLNSASKSSADNEFLLKQLQCGALFDDFSTFQCSVDVIEQLWRLGSN